MESDISSKVTLISSDGIKFIISQKAGMRSNYILKNINKEIVENKDKKKEENINLQDNNEQKDVNSITIDFIKGDILKKIVEYLEHYENDEPKEIEKPLPSSDLNEYIDDWDYNYIDVDLDTLFELNKAADKMKIKSLLELISAKSASLIRGHSPDEIRKNFGISNEFKPEEEKLILEENKWCMDNL